MAAPVESVEFRPPDTASIVAAMDAMTTAERGWITLQPGIHPDDEPPPRSLIGQVFAGTGPAVPVGTWVAPEAKQKPPHREIGILHQAGPKAVRRLQDAGLTVPDYWKVLADHPKRGLVIAIHPESPNTEVLDWIVRAVTILTKVPLTGSWKASFHGRA